MSDRDRDDGTTGDRISVRIGRDVSGQVAAGRYIEQQANRTEVPVRPEDLAELRRLVDLLKHEVTAAAPPQQQDAALERVRELQEAVVSEQPDVTTMAYVRNWFVKHLPQLAGAVTSVIVHPLVGRVVEAAGDLAAAEFRRQFHDL
jgi:hypothetical protein